MFSRLTDDTNPGFCDSLDVDGGEEFAKACGVVFGMMPREDISNDIWVTVRFVRRLSQMALYPCACVLWRCFVQVGR